MTWSAVIANSCFEKKQSIYLTLDHQMSSVDNCPKIIEPHGPQKALVLQI